MAINKSADPSRRDWQISYAESKTVSMDPNSLAQNPKSKIQNPKSKIHKSKIQNPNGAVWGRHKKNED